MSSQRTRQCRVPVPGCREVRVPEEDRKGRGQGVGPGARVKGSTKSQCQGQEGGDLLSFSRKGDSTDYELARCQVRSQSRCGQK